nr:hypothetical protein 18 [Saccharospirillaceae bacterium]
MTKTQAQQMLDRYIEAEQKVLAGQQISHNGKSWTMADLKEIRAGREHWERVLAQFNGRRRFAQATFAE